MPSRWVDRLRKTIADDFLRRVRESAQADKRRMDDFHRAEDERQKVITGNKSRRMRGLPQIPVPPKPERPQVRIAYEADGTYAGRLMDGEPVPPGCTVRIEDAV